MFKKIAALLSKKPEPEAVVEPTRVVKKAPAKKVVAKKTPAKKTAKKG